MAPTITFVSCINTLTPLHIIRIQRHFYQASEIRIHSIHNNYVTVNIIGGDYLPWSHYLYNPPKKIISNVVTTPKQTTKSQMTYLEAFEHK